MRYDHDINSTKLVTRLREEKSVLIVPGDHFGMDGYLRLGFGEPPEYNRAGLDRLKELLASLPASARPESSELRRGLAEAASGHEGGPARG